MEFHPLARLVWPSDCMLSNCQRWRGPSPRTGKPTLQVSCRLSSVDPSSEGGEFSSAGIVRDVTAGKPYRAALHVHVPSLPLARPALAPFPIRSK